MSDKEFKIAFDRANELLERLDVQCRAVGHPAGGIDELKHIIKAAFATTNAYSNPPYLVNEDGTIEKITFGKCEILVKSLENFINENVKSAECGVNSPQASYTEGWADGYNECLEAVSVILESREHGEQK